MITFDENLHKYYDENGKELVSVTTLLAKHGITADYTAVKTEVLAKKAARGTLIHKEIEEFVKEGKEGFTNELFAFEKYCKDNNVELLKSEEMVHNDIIAGTYDLLIKRNEKVVRVDVKTTYKTDKVGVSYQLSLYDYLDTDIKADELEVFHFDEEGNLEVSPVKRVETSELEKLIECERIGIKYSLPTINLPAELETKIVKAYTDYVLAEELKKRAEEALDNFKGMVIELMEANGITKFENDVIKISYTAPYDKETLDTARLKKEHAELVKDYIKVVPTKGSIKITMKGDKK